MRLPTLQELPILCAIRPNTKDAAEVLSKTGAMQTTLQFVFRNKLHLATLAALGAATWAIFFGVPIIWQCLLTVFLLTLSIYQYNRLTDAAEDALNQPENLQAAQQQSHFIRYGLFYAATIVCFALAASCGWQPLWLTVFLAVIGFLYNQKCFPEWLARALKGARRLKDLYIVKNLVPPIDWATAMIFLPLVFAGKPLSLQAWICWGYLFTCAFFIEVMWDIRDRHGDMLSGIKTIANSLSLYSTKVLLVVSSSLSGLGLFLATYFGVLPQVSYFLLSNNVAVMVIASSYRDDAPNAARWLSDMTIVLALLLFASFGAIAFLMRA